jgi:hypothetical protein
MASDTATQINLSLAFPRAAVAFVIKVAGANGQAPSFHLHVTDTSGNRVPLKADASPQLADWVRGYTRWLYRSRVSASHDSEAITGTFADGLTPEQVLQGVQDACDMIRQRFEPYSGSILS